MPNKTCTHATFLFYLSTFFNLYFTMAETLTSLTLLKPSSFQLSRLDVNSSSRPFRQCSSLSFDNGCHQIERARSKRGSSIKVKAFPDWPLMAVLVEQMEGQRDLITHKSIWHLNNMEIKNVYTLYIMFTVWGCCVFGSVKDPYYDSEVYRKDGGDGTGHWVYEKQEDIEEQARAELWREELIEEIEQKVGGLRELEEATKKEEELVK